VDQEHAARQKGMTMSTPALPRPTDAELEILNILWRQGSSTLREIYQIVAGQRKTGLTTTLKTLQIMTHKGLVIRDVSKRPSSYTPALPERTTRGKMLDELIQKAFEGSARKLLVQAVEEGGLSDQELAEIRKLIDSLRTQKRGQAR
jgi:BlaI family transcriptional regulator, penicillinase repressor